MIGTKNCNKKIDEYPGEYTRKRMTDLAHMYNNVKGLVYM